MGSTSGSVMMMNFSDIALQQSFKMYLDTQICGMSSIFHLKYIVSDLVVKDIIVINFYQQLSDRGQCLFLFHNITLFFSGRLRERQALIQCIDISSIILKPRVKALQSTDPAQKTRH